MYESKHEKIYHVSLTTSGKLKHYVAKHFFGIMQVHFLIEDRENPDSSRAFKHQIYVTILDYRIFSAIIHSSSEGVYFSNAKEIV